MSVLQEVASQLKADVFSVTESLGPVVYEKLTVEEALPQLFGSHLKGFGLVDDGNSTQNATKAEVFRLTSKFNQIKFWAIDGTPQQAWTIRNMSTVHGLEQWFKLSEAWKLMEDFETQRGADYDKIVKLRFDWCVSFRLPCPFFATSPIFPNPLSFVDF